MAESSAQKTPANRQLLTTTEISELAVKDARVTLLRKLLPGVQPGKIRCADVAKVGPAIEAKCKISVGEWDRLVDERKPFDRCGGTFYAHFGGKSLSRQCDNVDKDVMCELCTKM